jgi:uncharacterized membrane protein YccC
VIFSYCSANPGAFHRPRCGGLRVLERPRDRARCINPQVAARLARALDRWSKLAEPYRSAAREALARVAAKPDLSKDTHEVVTRALAELRLQALKRNLHGSTKISLTRYLVEQQRADGLIPGQLRLLLEVVARACKSISQAVNKGALGGVLGTAESENVQGESRRSWTSSPTKC